MRITSHPCRRNQTLNSGATSIEKIDRIENASARNRPLDASFRAAAERLEQQGMEGAAVPRIAALTR
jgi:hypothetical protein